MTDVVVLSSHELQIYMQTTLDVFVWLKKNPEALTKLTLTKGEKCKSCKNTEVMALPSACAMKCDFCDEEDGAFSCKQCMADIKPERVASVCRFCLYSLTNTNFKKRKGVTAAVPTKQNKPQTKITRSLSLVNARSALDRVKWERVNVHDLQDTFDKLSNMPEADVNTILFNLMSANPSNDKPSQYLFQQLIVTTKNT
jgi:hypothetical protein